MNKPKAAEIFAREIVNTQAIHGDYDKEMLRVTAIIQRALDAAAVQPTSSHALGTITDQVVKDAQELLDTPYGTNCCQDVTLRLARSVVSTVQPSQSAVECARDLMRRVNLSHGCRIEHDLEPDIAALIQAFAAAQQPAVQPVQSNAVAQHRITEKQAWVFMTRLMDRTNRGRLADCLAHSWRVAGVSGVVLCAPGYKETRTIPNSGKITGGKEELTQVIYAVQPADAVREALAECVRSLDNLVPSEEERYLEDENRPSWVIAARNTLEKARALAASQPKGGE